MDVVIAGSSGFLGTNLVTALQDRGHHVTRLVRREASAADESAWDPYAGEVDQSVIDAADVVINLAGSPLIGNPHSKKWATDLVSSRVTTTRVLADATARSHRSGAGSPAYLAGSGISFYGDHGDQTLSEDDQSQGEAFLTGVTQLWQDAARPAVDAGARVAILRTAPVIDRTHPPLKPMLLPFKLGLGARLGSGSQFFPIISLRDWVGAVAHLAEHDSAHGPFNLCCPITPTNAEFTEVVCTALGSKPRLAVPAFVLRRAAGRMAPEILGSMRTQPTALVETGYEFADHDVRDVVTSALRPR
ncbi:TIGR01777 family protein [Nocardioides sp. JQ2195]|uniref:TIGR01777 family oxidoreductase n=1 Tax=Nocardioides sp. JQ2195 TaxID=2592334 RepID=UPI00143E3F02|nr:TIGR01777 family oxidoreductase [Nocardioides sp. JQ2195]QIX27048.1 TIGR01777 family protein [Nocardioides sp. JQ2195]